MDAPQVIEDWFEQYRHDVFNYLVYTTGRFDVEDLVQETFLRALRHMERFAYKSSPKTWLLAIARNLAIDEARKNSREKIETACDVDALVNNSAYGLTPDEAVTFTETQREIMEAICSLSHHHRDVITLRLVMGLSVKETAATLEWMESRVRVTFFRGINQLRRKLASVKREVDLHELV